jgi:hypothetical protein
MNEDLDFSGGGVAVEDSPDFSTKGALVEGAPDFSSEAEPVDKPKRVLDPTDWTEPARSPEELAGRTFHARRLLGLGPDGETRSIKEIATSPLVKLSPMSAQELADALDAAWTFSGAGPEVSPEDTERYLAEPSRKPTKTEQVAAGAVNVANRASSAMTSPLGVAAVAAAPVGAPVWLQRLISAGFAVDMARGVPELARTAGEASVNGDLQQQVEAFGDLGTTVAMTAGAAGHVVAPRGAAVDLARVLEQSPVQERTRFETRPRSEMVERLDEEGRPLTTAPDFSGGGELVEAREVPVERVQTSEPLEQKVVAPAGEESKVSTGETITGLDEGKASEMPAETAVDVMPGNAEPVGPAVPLKPTNSPKAERPFDILDAIQENVGKIRGKRSASPGSEGYYGELYKDTQRHGAARQLFSNKKGVSPDDAAEALRRAGYLNGDATVDDMWEAMAKAAQARKGNREAQSAERRIIEKEEAQQIDFERHALKPGKETQPIPVTELLEGDELMIDGAKFKVKEMVFDPDTTDLSHVVLEDGRRFGVKTVGPEQVIHADEGSVKLRERSTDFVPAEEMGLGDSRKSAEEVEAERLRAEQKAKLEELRHRRLIGGEADSTMDMFDPLAADNPLLAQKPKELFSSSSGAAARGVPHKGPGPGGPAPRPGPLPSPTPVPSPGKAPGTRVPVVLPRLGQVWQHFQNLRRSIQSVVSPQNLDPQARIFSLMLRENNAQAALDLVRSDEKLHAFRSMFDRTPVPKDWAYDPAKPLPYNFAVMDALERDRSKLPAELQDFAKRFDDEFAWRILEVRRLAPAAMKTLITNYFPHMWEKSTLPAVRALMAEVAARAPLHGNKAFLKSRTVAFFHEGLQRGLKPISDNPVDLLLAKMHQMDKFILAERTLQEAKAAGMRKYLPLGRKMPDGWVIVKDPSFTVHLPPTLTVKEAFDAGIRSGLMDFIKKMGFRHERVAGLGVDTWGIYRSGGEIKSKFGGPDSVITHEIGHGLDERYGLWSYLASNATLRKEMMDLAHKRAGAGPMTPKFKKYVELPEEQIANVVHAYVHAPELMQSVAPNVQKAFANFIRSRPELEDLNEIKPTLALAHSQSELPLAGPVLAGHWIMPAGPAAVLSNYLSPGLQRFLPYRSLRAMGNILNGAQLGLSAFHVGFTSLDASISSAAVGLQYLLRGKLGRGVVNLAAAPLAPVGNYYIGKAVQERMVRPGTTGVRVLDFPGVGIPGLRVPVGAKIEAGLNAVAKLAVKGGLRATTDPFWQTQITRNMVRAFHSGTVGGYAGTLMRAPFAIVEQAMRPIAEYLVPRQKLGVFAQLAFQEMDRLGPGADNNAIRDAMAKAADTTEDRMGQMTYDNLFYHRMVKDLALIGFRAYGWQLGKYRASFGAVSDWLKFAYGGAEKTVAAVSGRKSKTPALEMSNRMLYPAALVMTTAAIGGLVHYLATGKRPEDATDYFFPQNGQVDEHGRPQRLALPTYLKDLASDWHDFPDVSKMGASFYHKLNPIYAVGVDMLRNRDFYDTEIRHEDDPVWSQARDLLGYAVKSATPFSITGYQKMAEADSPELQRLLPFVGVVPAKRAVVMTPAEARAADIMQGMMPAGTRTKEEFERSKFKGELVRDLKLNPMKGKEELVKGVNAGKLSVDDVTQLINRTQLSPLQYQVHKMPAEQAMKVWDLANDKERGELRAILAMKLADAKNLDPEALKRYLQQVLK